jgi:hypothetical protein
MWARDDEFLLLPPHRSAVAFLFLLTGDRSPRGSWSLWHECKREVKKGKWGLGFGADADWFCSPRFVVWLSDENGWCMAIGPTGAAQASVAFHWPRPTGRLGDGGCTSEVSKRSWAEQFWANFTSWTVKEELFSCSCFSVEVLRPSREALLGPGHGRGLGHGRTVR